MAIVAREGYELWRPNREKAESKTTKAVVALVLLISAGLIALIVIPAQILLIAVAMVGFNQEWHVEEERPVGSDGYGDRTGAPTGLIEEEPPAANRPELSREDDYLGDYEADAEPQDVRADEE